MTVTELPQLAHTESSNTNSVRTGSEPRLTHRQESGSQRSSKNKKQRFCWNAQVCRKPLKITGDSHQPTRSLCLTSFSTLRRVEKTN